MRKTLSAAQVKKLPAGTDVLKVRDATGQVARLWVVKSGRKKMLKGVYAEFDIKDQSGWHYEIEEVKSCLT